MVMAKCQLPYPDRYDRALHFYNAWPQDAQQPSQDTQLILYGLSSQVAHGPCRDPQPSSWNTLEHAKWTAWRGLKDMDKLEAMRLFVKTLEEDEPRWYALMDDGEAAETNGHAVAHRIHSLPCDDTWRSPWVTTDKHPYPRFEHSCCLLGNAMYIFGGNCAGGRYLSDVWQLDLDTLSWTDVSATFSADDVGAESGTPPGFPATAAAAAVQHRGRVLLVGGHVKENKKNPRAPLTVRVLDPAARTWSVLGCDGDVPRTRGGHVVCVIGECLYVFGGEGPTRRLEEGVRALDLATNTWATLEIQSGVKGPSPRSALVATAYQGRYLLTFGGGATGHCHGDLWYLDTATATWHEPPVSGAGPAPRAGCSAALLDDYWYVFGGGNNSAGCPDMWRLGLHRLGTDSLQWEQICTFDMRSSLASEGASAVAVPALGALVAFGGYNGTYHNAVSVFKPAQVTPVSQAGSAGVEPVERVSEIQPAEAREQDDAHAPQANGHRAAPPAQQRQHSTQLEEAHRAAQAALEDATAANSSLKSEVEALRQQLAAAQQAAAAAEAEAAAVREELAAEKDRAFRAEVQVSAAQDKLRHAGELEEELAKHKETAAEQGKKAGGLWGYISGA